MQYSVVHSLDGYDEISLTDTTKIMTNAGEFVFTPEELGFQRLKQEDLWGGNTIDDVATIFMNVLENKATEAQKNAVIINSAVAIQTRMPLKSIEQCIEEAEHSLEGGYAKNVFGKFVEIYR